MHYINHTTGSPFFVKRGYLMHPPQLFSWISARTTFDCTASILVFWLENCIKLHLKNNIALFLFFSGNKKFLFSKISYFPPIWLTVFTQLCTTSWIYKINGIYLETINKMIKQKLFWLVSETRPDCTLWTMVVSTTLK